MDIFGVMSSINKYGRYFVLLVVLANIVSVSFADTGSVDNITAAMEAFCRLATTVLAAAIVVLIILAAVIYAIGQVMGAETRARASVWATAMLTGAVIGAVIYILMPYLLNFLLGGEGSTQINLDDPCDFGGTTGGSS